jgi:hypothetical protein
VGGFAAAASGGKTAEAMDWARKKTAKPVYLKPGEVVENKVAGFKVHVLGPPRNRTQIRKDMPTRAGKEVYELGADRFAAAERAFFGAAFEGVEIDHKPEFDRSLPFDRKYQIALDEYPGPTGDIDEQARLTALATKSLGTKREVLSAKPGVAAFLGRARRVEMVTELEANLQGMITMLERAFEQEIEHRQTERYPLPSLQEQALQILNDYTAGTRILKVQAEEWPDFDMRMKDIVATLSKFRRHLKLAFGPGLSDRSDDEVLQEARERNEEALRGLLMYLDRLRDLRETTTRNLIDFAGG